MKRFDVDDEQKTCDYCYITILLRRHTQVRSRRTLVERPVIKRPAESSSNPQAYIIYLHKKSACTNIKSNKNS